MLQIFPFLQWLAPIASAVLLILLSRFGDLSRRAAGLALGCFLIAGYMQFFGGSPVMGAVGLLLQTLVALALFLRWRVSA